jgi:osmoprotectant transport system substrate-binding protein
MSFRRGFTLLACAVAVLALAGVGLAGCGQSGSGDAATAVATNTRQANLPGAGKPPVIIGDKNFTEQFLLGELYDQALTARGYTVMLNRNIGPTEVTLQALYSGRLSMYPEYLSTWNTAVAGVRRRFSSQRSAYLAARAYARAHGLRLLRPTTFSDTSAIAITAGYAALHRLRALNDLRTVGAGVTLGAAPQFQTSLVGLPALKQAYGFVPAGFKPLAIGAQYQALERGLVQTADVATTDGQLASRNYVLLKDPRRAFGWGQVVPVVPERVLAAEGPAFPATINRVSRLLTTRVMRKLNAAVDVYQQDPATVAARFLQAHGLVQRPTS